MQTVESLNTFIWIVLVLTAECRAAILPTSTGRRTNQSPPTRRTVTDLSQILSVKRQTSTATGLGARAGTAVRHAVVMAILTTRALSAQTASGAPAEREASSATNIDADRRRLSRALIDSVHKHQWNQSTKATRLVTCQSPRNSSGPQGALRRLKSGSRFSVPWRHRAPTDITNQRARTCICGTRSPEVWFTARTMSKLKPNKLPRELECWAWLPSTIYIYI